MTSLNSTNGTETFSMSESLLKLIFGTLKTAEADLNDGLSVASEF